MNAASANQRLLMMLKSFAMLDVGMCGDPCDPCGCCSVGSFLVAIVGSPPLLRVSTLHSYGENLRNTNGILGIHARLFSFLISVSLSQDFKISSIPDYFNSELVYSLCAF